MVEAGTLGPDDPVELLDGLLFQKTLKDAPHTIAILNLARWLNRRCGDTHIVRSQMPIHLRGNNRPEPDIAVVPGNPDGYPQQPAGEQVVLAVEVADKASFRALWIKRTIYAQNGVRELWVVNVARRTIELHRQPSQDGYRSVALLAEHEPFAPLFLSAQALKISDILPKLADLQELQALEQQGRCQDLGFS